MGWFLVRQDTHGTRYDVANYETETEANEAMASFEAGYPHHQTYYVEHRHTADEIETISAVEAIRRRPALYLGAEAAGINDLVFEALCLSLTEAHCGTVGTITVTAVGLDVEISNDGLGLSLEPDRNGIPFAESIMTSLYACRDHSEHQRLKHELCEMGIVVVNALSTRSSIHISHGTTVQEQRYTKGRPDGPFVDTGRATASGTTLRFSLDPEFLADVNIDPAAIRSRLADVDIDLAAVAIQIDASPTRGPA